MSPAFGMDPSIDLNGLSLMEAMPLEFDIVPLGSNIDQPPTTGFGGFSVDVVQDFGLQATIAPQPTAIDVPQTAPNNALQPTRQTRIVCSYNGCNRSYVRAGDCRRHMRTHQPHRLRCVDTDCSMTFYRLDKLRTHAKTRHNINL
jgi:hypothetical protein